MPITSGTIYMFTPWNSCPNPHHFYMKVLPMIGMRLGLRVDSSHKFWFSRISSIPGVNWEVSLSDSTSALFHSANICRLNIYFYQKLTKSLCGKDSSESELLESDQSHLQCSGVEQVSGASTILINRRVVGLFASKTTTAHETALWYKTQLSV